MELPEFVSLEGIALRLSNDKYVRDAGKWFTRYVIRNGVLYSYIPSHQQIHNKELKPISKEDYIKENGIYSQV